MSISNSYPTQRPSLNLDFANSGKLDSRISYSRSSTGTAFSSERHLSSLNLVTNSEDFSAWSESNATVTSNTTAAPDGNTTASTMTGNAGTAEKRLQSNSVAVTDPVISVYAKAGTHNYIQISDNQSSQEYGNFDLANGTVGNVGTLATAAIEAVGSTGWYRCLMRVERTASAFTWRVFMIDSSTAARQSTTSSTGTVHLWGGMMTELGDLTNVVAYQSSGSQVHREFAPTLKSYSSDQPRFEYDPATDGQSAAGSPRGLLIESSASNLQRYGSAFASWSTSQNVSISSNSAVGPNGELEADLLVPTAGSLPHWIYDGQASVASGTTYTFSVYLKAAGYRYVQLLALASLQSSGHITFDLETGTLSASGAHTGTIKSVGNGWFRASATVTATSTTTSGFLIAGADSLSNGRNPQTTGNSYDGWLCWGAQLEANSVASSLVNSGTSSSGVTRASDSCSLVSAPLLDNGGGTIYAESSPNNLGSVYSGIVSLNAGGLDNRIEIIHNYAALRSTVSADGTTYNATSGGTFSNGDNIQSCLIYETDSVSLFADGAKIGATDTSAVMPEVFKLTIGNVATGSFPLNGHLKRLAVYSDSISETSASALTSS